MKRIAIAGLMLYFAAAIISCNRTSSDGSCCSTSSSDAGSTEISGLSVFQLNNEWETYRDETVTLKDFGGKVIVSAMIFTSCPSACPRLVADMKNIEEKLSPEEREKVQFLLISMDPENDDPETMRQFAEDFRLNDSWELIRSDEASTMEIAQVLGVKVKPLEGGGFDHSNIIHFMNRKGEIVHQQHGLNMKPEEGAEIVRELIKG